MSRHLFDISKKGNFPASLGTLCQCSVNCTAQKCLLMFRQNLLCSILFPLPLVLLPGTTERSLAPCSLHPLFRYLYTLMRSPCVFSSPG